MTSNEVSKLMKWFWSSLVYSVVALFNLIIRVFEYSTHAITSQFPNFEVANNLLKSFDHEHIKSTLNF